MTTVPTGRISRSVVPVRGFPDATSVNYRSALLGIVSFPLSPPPNPHTLTPSSPPPASLDIIYISFSHSLSSVSGPLCVSRVRISRAIRLRTLLHGRCAEREESPATQRNARAGAGNDDTTETPRDFVSVRSATVREPFRGTPLSGVQPGHRETHRTSTSSSVLPRARDVLRSLSLSSSRDPPGSRANE